MRKLFITITIALSSMGAFAQQEAMFTHYMFNTLTVNPAYAGSRDALTITALNRIQWAGFDGAPITQTFTAHSPIINQNLGLGLSITRDEIGPTNTTSFYADFSYKLKFNTRSSLAFGLSGGLNIRQNDLTKLKLDQTIDESFAADEKSDLLPNFGFGMYYSTDKYYIGLSVPRILQNDFKNNESKGGTNLASEERHYFLIAGAVFDLNSDLKLKPTTFLKVTNGVTPQLDLTSILIIKEKVWGGLMYRTNDAVGALAGVYINNRFAVAYSFDWSFGNITKYHGGTHEIMLTYDFIYKSKTKFHSPRYF
jgi:type IX secretion system PorP/SprF family membrane protein